MKHASILRRLTAWSLGVLALGGTFAAAVAQPWPERPVTIMMPYVAGGATDVGVRDIARKMSEILGQPVIVDNKPGAGASIAAQAVARAKPDGYTLLAAVVANMVTNPLLTPNIGYDPLTSFAPVSLLSVNPLILVASKQSNIKTFPEFIRRAREKPGELAIASYGMGTPAHLTIELLKTTAKIDVNHIPYNGSAAAAIDVFGGRVPLMIDILPSHIKTMESGQVTGIAIGQLTRSPLAPNIPTFHESGLQNFEATTWFGLVAPAGTPPEVIAKLNQAARRALEDPELQKSMLARGTAPKSTSPAEFSAFIRSDFERWRAVVVNAGLQAK